MNEFINMVLGGYSIERFMGYLFFMLIGILIFTFQDTSNRDRQSKNTPNKFSVSFLILDNAKRYMLTLLLIYVQFRFFKELTGQELNEYSALLIGYMGDGLAAFGKQNTKILRSDRNKLLKSKKG